MNTSLQDADKTKQKLRGFVEANPSNYSNVLLFH